MDRPLRPGIILAAAVILPALLFIALVEHDGRRQRDRLHQDAAIATALAREQTLRILDIGMLSLDRAQAAVAGLNWSQIRARRPAVQDELRQVEESRPDTLAMLALVQPDGHIAAAGGPEPAPHAPISCIDLMRVAREGRGTVTFEAAPKDVAALGAGLLIGRARAPEGRPFDGAVLAMLRAEDFFTAWAQAVHQPDARFALVRSDGAVLLRQDAARGMPANLGPDDALRHAIMGAAPPGGRQAAVPFIADPFGDGAAQLVFWRPLGSLPLNIVYTVPATPTQRIATPSVAVNALACFLTGLFLALFAFMVRRRMQRDRETFRRLEANAADLRAEIARREAAETGLRNAQRMEGLGRLTGGVAHDFNNLLTAILGTARALERHLGPRADERTKRLLEAAVAAVDRGARLNASLLAFARRQPLVLATVNANALVEDFKPLLRRALDESISLDIVLDQKLPTCRADAAQLEAALLNLVINARDAMPRGGTIRVVSRRAWLQEQALTGNPEARPGPYVAIEVRDSGEGMSPEVRERAFEPFFTTKPNGTGTGLGLSQVFGFMRQIGGHVAIQSVPGRGTTVTLYLPLGTEIDAKARRTAPTAGGAPISGAGVSVLVVEDEPAVRGVAVEMLADAGFSVLAAPDGPTALQLLREGVPADIIFSDVVMPGGMSGMDLAREARKLRPAVGILLASGYAAEALAKHGGAGEFDLISKPYDMEGLLSRLGVLMQRQRGPIAAPPSQDNRPAAAAWRG
jgi:signal transduction histidine kinase/CheY-like chemotaxis protein